MNLLDVTISTVRLLLVPTSLDIKEECFKEFDKEVTVFMAPVPAKTIADTEEFVNTSRRNMAEGKELVCAIFNKDTKEFLGHAGLHHIDTMTPELGVWIKKSAHGMHYGSEAMQALKKWADEHVDYEYILYPVAAVNVASRKIPESLGGKVIREYEKANGAGKKMSWVDYRIYKKEFGI
ncbi:MAG: N-acetyltransferase [Candidatus Magasanikbacteria bacterium]|nr:N-acetyltransferase [Candidatus Magasanikbacteria bacterium]